MTANPDTTYHVVGTQRDDHTQYARTDGTRVFTGTVTAPVFQATKSGTGEYVGTTNGAPLSGTFNTGDFANDPTNNVIWQCTAGGTPGTWESGSPVANPVGRCYRNASGSFLTGTNIFTFDTSAFVAGSVAFTALTGTGLTVPLTAKYQVNAQLKVANTTGAGSFAILIVKNNTVGTVLSYGEDIDLVAGLFQAVTLSDILSLTTNDVVNVAYINSTAGNITVQNDGTMSNYLSLSLVSK